MASVGASEFFTQLIRRIAAMENDIERLKRVENGPRVHSSPLLILGGVVTILRGYHTLLPESGTSDDLDTITAVRDGTVLILRPEQSGDTITLKDGTGNLSLAGGDIVLSAPNQTAMLVYAEPLSAWIKLI